MKTEKKGSASAPPDAAHPSVSDEKVRHWFWAGFFLSIPVSFFVFGKDPAATKLVLRLSILCAFIPVVPILIYRMWKRLRIDGPIFKDSRVASYYFKAIMFVCGHGIGFVTVNFFRNL